MDYIYMYMYIIQQMNMFFLSLLWLHKNHHEISIGICSLVHRQALLGYVKLDSGFLTRVSHGTY